MFLTSQQHKKKFTETGLIKPISGLVVDGSFLWSTRKLQYQIVDLETSELIYTSPVYLGGSANVAEYLAIIHGLAYSAKNRLNCDIYTDSCVARGWIVQKKCKTREPMSEELKSIVYRGTFWINQNLSANKILFWNNKIWGENPADFGRK